MRRHVLVGFVDRRPQPEVRCSFCREVVSDGDPERVKWRVCESCGTAMTRLTKIVRA